MRSLTTFSNRTRGSRDSRFACSLAFSAVLSRLGFPAPERERRVGEEERDELREEATDAGGELMGVSTGIRSESSSSESAEKRPRSGTVGDTAWNAARFSAECSKSDIAVEVKEAVMNLLEPRP